MAEIPRFINDKSILHENCKDYRDASIKLSLNNCKYMICHYDVVRNKDNTFYINHDIDGIYNISNDGNFDMMLYSDDSILVDDISKIKLDNAIFICCMPYKKINITTTFPTIIRYKAMILSSFLKEKMIYNQFIKITKNTILKRLQNPELELGNYFIKSSGDLNKCGVSTYYLDRYGSIKEKKIIRVMITTTIYCEQNIATDIIDTWSSSIPQKCKGGETIYNLENCKDSIKILDDYLFLNKFDDLKLF